MNIEIRLLSSPEECVHLRELERLVWGAPGEDLIPIHIAITVLKNGGGVLGAFSADGPQVTGGMVGMTLWFLGCGRHPRTGEQGVKACSHILGILPAFQGRQIGTRLKLAQHEQVLAQGVTDWITWTYDPLFAANAMLNVHRLGAIGNTYIRNIYGIMDDELNKGVPSDRCQVDWLLNEAHVLTRFGEPRQVQLWDADRLVVLPSEKRTDGLPVPGALEISVQGAPLAIPIPDDIAAIRRADSALSLQWRYYLRTAFEQAFAAGYTVVECIQLPDKGPHYILTTEAST